MRRILAVAVLALTSCYVDSAYRSEAPGPRGNVFGYLTAGLQVHVDYSGDLDLKDGKGWRVGVPPLVPLVFAADVVLVGGVMAIAATAQDAGVILELDGMFLIPPDEPAVWTSGKRDPGALFSEVSWELTLEGSSHGSDSALRLLAGLKVAADRGMVLRPYGCGGWSWHWLEMAAAGDVSANGPYVGIGLEFFSSPAGCVGLDGRWHWVRAEGYGTSRLLTVEVSWSAHW